MQNLPALTIKQPWAELIMLGIKDIENRPWTTTYRGTIFIHAGLTWDDSPWPEDRVLDSVRPEHFNPEKMIRGAIIGTVCLVNIIDDSVSPWAVKGKNHFVITRPQFLFNPVPWRGQQGLWWPSRFTG